MQNKMYLMIAAEYLIAQKYTSSNFLAIRGGSNGGLLVGTNDTATRINESSLASSRSDGHVALPYLTAGAGWAYDYGTSQDSKEMFEYIKGYSVQNVKAGTISSDYGYHRRSR
jgi:prolyl oligopeptidase